MVAADDLIELLAKYELDPLGFAQVMFPWGEPGDLEHEELEDWQREALDYIGRCLRKGQNVIRLGRATGHGVGKSALASILTWWAMSTVPNAKGVVTANTETQLKTKTWPEIGKWHRLFLAKDLFEVTATAIFPRDKEHDRTWRFDIVPWSERNTEAFAGLHNKGRRIFVLMDEASAIPDMIHEVAEGALTDADTQIIWVMFGNPTRNTGRFREAAPGGKFGHRWQFEMLDSRTVRRTNKQVIADWIQDYGEDSDFVRVRVKGMFPRQDAVSFIPYELAMEATKRPIREGNEYRTVIGVDVARFGDDLSSIFVRRGADGRSIHPQLFHGLRTTELAWKVRAAVLEYDPEAVFVDEGGVGAGVVDTLLDMKLPCMIYGVDFGRSPDGISRDKTANKRAEMWACMREWLATGCIPDFVRGLDHSLVEELTAPTFGLRDNDGAIQLERKADIKKRNKWSPDVADSLALSFALTFLPIPLDRYGRPPKELAPDYDYNPLEAF
jgi:hypothetical protein